MARGGGHHTVQEQERSTGQRYNLRKRLTGDNAESQTTEKLQESSEIGYSLRDRGTREKSFATTNAIDPRIWEPPSSKIISSKRKRASTPESLPRIILGSPIDGTPPAKIRRLFSESAVVESSMSGIPRIVLQSPIAKPPAREVRGTESATGESPVLNSPEPTSPSPCFQTEVGRSMSLGAASPTLLMSPSSIGPSASPEVHHRAPPPTPVSGSPTLPQLETNMRREGPSNTMIDLQIPTLKQIRSWLPPPNSPENRVSTQPPTPEDQQLLDILTVARLTCFDRKSERKEVLELLGLHGEQRASTPADLSLGDALTGYENALLTEGQNNAITYLQLAMLPTTDEATKAKMVDAALDAAHE